MQILTTVIARSASDEAIQDAYSGKALDCFAGARNDETKRKCAHNNQ
jgi:hypothetical protein